MGIVQGVHEENIAVARHIYIYIYIYTYLFVVEAKTVCTYTKQVCPCTYVNMHEYVEIYVYLHMYV